MYQRYSAYELYELYTRVDGSPRPPRDDPDVVIAVEPAIVALLLPALKLGPAPRRVT
jgi:hypothetical protein